MQKRKSEKGGKPLGLGALRAVGALFAVLGIDLVGTAVIIAFRIRIGVLLILKGLLELIEADGDR